MYLRRAWQDLGFRRYAAHGGKLGAGITSRLAEDHPESVIDIRRLAVGTPVGLDLSGVTHEALAYLDAFAALCG